MKKLLWPVETSQSLSFQSGISIATEIYCINLQFSFYHQHFAYD